MMYLFKLMSVLLVTSIIGPYSQAILSNDTIVDMNYHGYQCSSGLQRQNIIIYYKENLHNEKSCHVNTQKNFRAKELLWSVKRNHNICYRNASALATRLIDRGWQCQSATLTPIAALKKEVANSLKNQ